MKNKPSNKAKDFYISPEYTTHAENAELTIHADNIIDCIRISTVEQYDDENKLKTMAVFDKYQAERLIAILEIAVKAIK